jgi:hypothetical protein
VNEPDVSLLLRSPSLALEPPADLVAGVRRRARRVRRRQQAAGAALVLAAVAAGGSVLPGLLDRGTASSPAGREVDPRAPDATSEVVELRLLNGASVITWWEGRVWCTDVRRVTTQRRCVGPVSEGPGLTRVDTTLTVDDRVVAAGTVGADVASVEVEQASGSPLAAELVDGEGSFRQRVWSVELPKGAEVTGYVAYDAGGSEVARRPG